MCCFGINLVVISLSALQYIHIYMSFYAMFSLVWFGVPFYLISDTLYRKSSVFLFNNKKIYI